MKIFESEYRFCLILWENEPITRTELAEICSKKLDWSKTTTYTVIKRLSDRGVLEVDKKTSAVTSLISKEQAQCEELDELMEKRFEGSLPAFIAAFAKRQKLSDKDIAEIEAIINGGGTNNG